MGWFQVVNGRLHYRRLTRTPFVQWTQTPRGRATVATVGRYVRFPVFGRQRMARSRLWRELKAVAADERVQRTVVELARLYPPLLVGFAFADALPRTTVDLRRLVAVPRALVNARAYAMAKDRLAGRHIENGLRGGEALRDFFAVALVEEMDRALLAARPTTRRPVPAADEWASVGADTSFVWAKPFWSGPAWEGHHYLYEQPRHRLTRRQRRQLEAAIAELSASLASCSRAQLYETLQCAAATFKQ